MAQIKLIALQWLHGVCGTKHAGQEFQTSETVARRLVAGGLARPVNDNDMRLIAARPLTGDYGTVSPGEEFEAAEGVAASLVARALARPAGPPAVVYETYETKILLPEVLAGPAPFCRQHVPEPDQPAGHVPVPDAQPETVAAAGDPGVPPAEIPAPGTADRSGRLRRGRSRTGE